MVEGVDRVNSSANLKSVNLLKRNKNEQDENNINLNESTSEEKQLTQKELKNKLEEKIEDMNKITETLEENLSFKLHDETDRIMVQVVNVKTQEIVKEMPPEEMLDLSAKIHKMVGLLIDEKV